MLGISRVGLNSPGNMFCKQGKTAGFTPPVYDMNISLLIKLYYKLHLLKFIK